jgi:hypothetical protein
MLSMPCTVIRGDGIEIADPLASPWMWLLTRKDLDQGITVYAAGSTAKISPSKQESTNQLMVGSGLSQQNALPSTSLPCDVSDPVLITF